MRIPRRSTSWVAGAAAAAVAGSAVAWRRHRAASRLTGQTVVITGGSRGLGFALTTEFLARGAQVWLLARDLVRARARLRPVSPRIGIVPCDVRDVQSALMAVSAIVDRTGRIDVLVDNAGVMPVAPFAHTRIEDFEDSLRTLPSGRHAAVTDEGRLSRDLRLGWIARALPTHAAMRMNQRVADDEAGR